MIGNSQIIEARKNRLKPTAIFFEFDAKPMPEVYAFQSAEKQIAHGGYPVVYVLPDEVGKRQDLRFVVGCRVHVHGKKWGDDILTFVDQIVESGASHVVVTCIADNDDMMEYKNGNWVAYA